MNQPMYKQAVIKKLLQNSAEKDMLKVARERTKTIYACNGHWVVSLGEPAIPLLYRQAYAESVPVGQQGEWEAVLDDRGAAIDVSFLITDKKSVLEIWEAAKARPRDIAEITENIHHEFESGAKHEREIVNTVTGETVYVDDEYLSLFYGVAQTLVAKPTIQVDRPKEGSVPMISVWANELMVAVVMPCKGPEK